MVDSPPLALRGILQLAAEAFGRPSRGAGPADAEIRAHRAMTPGSLPWAVLVFNFRSEKSKRWSWCKDEEGGKAYNALVTAPSECLDRMLRVAHSPGTLERSAGRRSVSLFGWVAADADRKGFVLGRRTRAAGCVRACCSWHGLFRRLRRVRWLRLQRGSRGTGFGRPCWKNQNHALVG
jgi:hypothetical protein